MGLKVGFKKWQPSRSNRDQDETRQMRCLKQFSSNMFKAVGMASYQHQGNFQEQKYLWQQVSLKVL
jgi:hypothetical protein